MESPELAHRNGEPGQVARDSATVVSPPELDPLVEIDHARCNEENGLLMDSIDSELDMTVYKWKS